MNKIIIIALGILILTSAHMVLADSKDYALLCLSEGEIVEFSKCNSLMDDNVCSTDSCQICTFISDTGNYCPASLNKCNSKGLSCTLLGGNTTLDQTPPEMIIYSPIQDNNYNDRRIQFNISINEEARISYLDLLSGYRWKELCDYSNDCQKKLSLKDGFNFLSLKAKDKTGNYVLQNISFFIDSKIPRITRTEPKSGFISSHFEINFREDNPKDLILTYGNLPTGFRNYSSNIDVECIKGSREYSCKTSEIDLLDYDGQEIQYWFTLFDISGNSVQSSPISLKVDETNPLINNPDDFYSIDGRNVYFNIDINEVNFDEATYLDIEDSRPKEKRICSRLDSGNCNKKISFSDGSHNLIIYVKDMAGNYLSHEVSFFTDSKKPRITKTEPRRGFATGIFEINFREENPKDLSLTYGNLITGIRTQNLDLTTCTIGKRDYYCSTDVDLSDFDGQDINYWFTLIDKIGNIDESKSNSLTVDETFPVINSLDHTIKNRRVEFVLNITEDNFEEVEYIVDQSIDPGARYRRLCSRLRNNICEGRITLSHGLHTINLAVSDEAGNMLGESVEVEI
jgi:hypothetical protein